MLNSINQSTYLHNANIDLSDEIDEDYLHLTRSKLSIYTIAEENIRILRKYNVNNQTFWNELNNNDEKLRINIQKIKGLRERFVLE